MKVTLDIKDNKAKTFLDFIKSLDFIYVEREEAYKEPTEQQLLQEIKEAVHELKLVEQGKLKARPAQELLDEL